MNERFERAIALIDAANAEDPRSDLAGSESVPRELLYSRRMSQMLERFAPEASEILRLAVRAQHIQRWKSPRDSYPKTPEGYQQWRRELMRFHAKTAGALLREAGYGDDAIERIGALLQKRGLKSDAETQTLEDVIALVFVENYLAQFAREHGDYDEAKFVDILQKTLKKMSAHGREAAFTLISPPAVLLPLIEKAMTGV
ncbi:MAG: DUF4202 domain-containing protein [Burkholderiales bacterium]